MSKLVSKFKVGDRVEIIEEGSLLIGKIVTITKVVKVRCGFYYYLIDLDGGLCKWLYYNLKLHIEPSKEYTIHNLMEFSEQTEFISKDTKYKIFLGRLYWYNTNMSTAMWVEVNSNISLKEILNMKFTKVEYPKLKPMTFEEAITTEKKIKYEYNNESQDNFKLVNETIKSITESYATWFIRDILLEGTWFAEGVYE